MRRIGSVLNSEVAGGKYAYGSFGELLGAAPVVSASSNPYMPSYAGYAYDAESGFYQTMYRLLDSKTGRWVTRDPIAFGGGLTNLYSYVANSPLNFIDPLGLTQKQIEDAMAWLRVNHPELMGTTPPTVLDGPLPNGTDGKTNPFTGTITIDTSQSKSMVDIVDSVAHELMHRLQNTSEVIFNALFNPKEADKQHGDIITKAQEISQQYKMEMKNQGNTCPLR